MLRETEKRKESGRKQNLFPITTTTTITQRVINIYIYIYICNQKKIIFLISSFNLFLISKKKQINQICLTWTKQKIGNSV
jgi:hypothetical protein